MTREQKNNSSFLNLARFSFMAAIVLSPLMNTEKGKEIRANLRDFLTGGKEPAVQTVPTKSDKPIAVDSCRLN